MMKPRDLINLLNRAAAALETYANGGTLDGVALQELIEDLVIEADERFRLEHGADRYFIEWNGDTWQSVFPAAEAAKSHLHNDPYDAYSYMVEDCGVTGPITIRPR